LDVYRVASIDDSIYEEIPVEVIIFVFNNIGESLVPGWYHNRYIIRELPLSTEFAEVPK